MSRTKMVLSLLEICAWAFVGVLAKNQSSGIIGIAVIAFALWAAYGQWRIPRAILIHFISLPRGKEMKYCDAWGMTIVSTLGMLFCFVFR